MNVYARFDEIPPMTLQDIEETKRYGHTNTNTKMEIKITKGNNSHRIGP